MKEGYIPLSTAQYNIWLNEQFYSGSAINVIHGSLWLDDTVSPEQLKKAADTVIDHSDIFRLRFAADEGEPVQYLAEKPGRRCEIGPPCSLSEVRELLSQRSEKAFAFDRDTLYDLFVYPLDNGHAVLSIRIHHILLDGFGMRLLCDRIMAAYDQLQTGEAVTVPKSHFIDNLPAASTDLQADRAFWQDYLDALPDQPLLSYEKAGTLARHILCKRLDSAICHDIEGFCNVNQIPPYSIFAAALGLYLGRISQVNDSVIVLPRLGRASEESLSTLGVYTLAMPLRIGIDDSMCFADLCRRIRSQGHQVSAHKDYGYSRILSDLKVAGLLENHLTEFTLNFQKGRLGTRLPARLDFSACGAMGNHITLNVSDDSSSGQYSIDYDYRRDLFDRQRIEFLHASLMQIIAEAMGGVPLSEISILSSEEQEFALKISCGPRVDYDESETIISLFKKAVAMYPDRPAIIDVHRRLTYRELDQLSDGIARGLIHRGIGDNHLVAFMLHRSVDILVCMLGIMKSGAGFLPVDPVYPPGRIEYMIEDSAAALMIIDETTPVTEGQACITIPDLVRAEASSALPEIVPNQIAYCIYTSGTTGRPKGVLIEHRGIVNITRPENNPFNRDISHSGKGIVAIGSICFDISIFEIFVPLLNGMFVVMAPEEAMADPVAIAALLDSNGANILHCTPTRLSAYLTEPVFTKALAGVDVILAAGEILPGPLVETLKDRFGVRIYNGYGPTETTIGATISEAGDNESIGRPIGNVCIRIVDAAGKDMPLGAAGEILVGGHGVGRGYLNRPELNVEKFIAIDGERFYRTGDIGYLKADGRLMYQGRNDNQVKLRGLRIELSEIENCMRQIPGVSMCAVIVREISGQQHLVAFYSAASELAAANMKERLALDLTPYMIPDVFVFMERLPSTVNGKIDLQALRDYYITIERPYAAPATAEEEELCGIFASVLQAERVGAEDNFFEIGGTSLLAARVMLQARNKNIEFSYADVFKNPTPRQLAVAGKKVESAHNDDPLSELDYTDLEPVLKSNQEAVSGPSRRLGNVLLTGATGFLGAHILKELLDHPESVDKIYCLIRPKGKLNCQQRLNGTLFYYFEEIDPDLCIDRLFPVEGDITDAELFTAPLDVEINTVIHSAANVSHFAYGDVLQLVNTTGVRNIINFARKRGSTVVHISTLSVGGLASEMQMKAGISLDEASLYIGQRIFNSYILSKYLAEYHLLEAAAGGLPVKIMRVGNLQGRLSDGEFQMNLGSNAFARHLKSYALMKSAPLRLQSASVNFSPVDDTARAIYLLAGSPEENTIFHTFNPTSADYSGLFAALNTFGHQIEWIPDQQFDEMVDRLAASEETQSLVEGILMEQPDMHWREVPCTSRLTTAVLDSCGFSWGDITPDYLEKYFYALDSLGFFDI